MAGCPRCLGTGRRGVRQRSGAHRHAHCTPGQRGPRHGLITTGCGGCHSIDGLAQTSGQTSPNLSHVGSKGADYISESILDLNTVIAQPCPSGECAENVMPQSFGDVLSVGELDDLVAYVSGLR